MPSSPLCMGRGLGCFSQTWGTDHAQSGRNTVVPFMGQAAPCPGEKPGLVWEGRAWAWKARCQQIKPECDGPSRPPPPGPLGVCEHRSWESGLGFRKACWGKEKEEEQNSNGGTPGEGLGQMQYPHYMGKDEDLGVGGSLERGLGLSPPLACGPGRGQDLRDVIPSETGKGHGVHTSRGLCQETEVGQGLPRRWVLPQPRSLAAPP